jgi:hypothetical protein
MERGGKSDSACPADSSRRLVAPKLQGKGGSFPAKAEAGRDTAYPPDRGSKDASAAFASETRSASAESHPLTPCQNERTFRSIMERGGKSDSKLDAIPLSPAESVPVHSVHAVHIVHGPVHFLPPLLQHLALPRSPTPLLPSPISHLGPCHPPSLVAPSRRAEASQRRRKPPSRRRIHPRSHTFPSSAHPAI